MTPLLLMTLSWAAGADTFHSDRLPHADRSIRVGFWFGMSNNEVLTPELIDWIGRRASIVILNATEKGAAPCFDYASVVARFKQRFPDLPILLYDWCQWDYNTGPGGRVGGLSYAFLKGKTEWRLKDRAGRTIAGRALRLDVTNPDLRAWLASHVAANVKRFGTDGVAFDVTLARLGRPGRPADDRFLNGAELARQWPAATQELFRAVKKAMGERKLLLFNGLFANAWPGRLESQAELLQDADAAAVEFFGRNVHVPEGKANEKADFEQFVLDYVRLLPRHADKIIPVFGRSPRYVYLDYEEDYQIQRYCLASFLLAMTPLSTFKHHSHFQTSYAPPGRTYGLSYYADYDLDLGSPRGPAFEERGVHQRRFDKALVAVAPMHKGGGSIDLATPHYSPEGERYVGKVHVEEGAGLILLHAQPAAPPERIEVDTFDDGRPGMWRQPQADQGVRVISEDGARFLRVRVSDGSINPFHERRVQPIRSLTLYDRLSFRIRSTDAGGAMLVRVEVSDSSPPPPVREPRRPPLREETRTPYVVLVVRPEGGTFRFKPRDADIPYGQRRVGQAPYLLCPEATYRTDGSWRTVRLDLTAALARRAPHLRPHRVSEMRLIGEADLDHIVLELGAPMPLSPRAVAPAQRAGSTPADMTPRVFFHETFDTAEPLGWFKQGGETRLLGTREPGWRAVLGTHSGAACGIVKDASGDRRLVHKATSGGGVHKTRIACALARPVARADAIPVRLSATLTPTAVNAGGPNPWNKLFHLRVHERRTGCGYGLAFDVQANDGSPENRVLRISVFTPASMPNCDDFRRANTGFWVGPRMSADLKDTPLAVTVRFAPDPAAGKTRVRWEWVNTKTGARESGEAVRDGLLPEQTTLDTVELTPTRWADGAFDNIKIQTP